jgi:nucleoporin NUP82
MERPPKRIGSGDAETVEEVNSCVVLADGNLGYFVLTTVDDEPQAVLLDAPEHGLPTEQEFSDYMAVELPNRQARPTYQPPRELYEPLSFLQSRNSFVPDRHRPSSKEEIRLSAANLEILMRAHKALSKDTYRLQTAVSDLFVRCNRLRREFRDQIVRVSELTSKIDGVTGKEDELPGVEQGARGNAKVEERLEAVKKRQEAINARYESIRRKMASVGGTNLSEKEKAFAEELQTMERSLDQSVQTLTDDPDGSDVPAWQRLDKVKGLQKDLAKQAERATRESSDDRAATLVKIPSHSRKQEQLQIDDLLKRESELVEAATSRLQTLGISIPLENGS